MLSNFQFQRALENHKFYISFSENNSSAKPGEKDEQRVQELEEDDTEINEEQIHDIQEERMEQSRSSEGASAPPKSAVTTTTSAEALQKQYEQKLSHISLLLSRAETKYNLGKFSECVEDCEEAEKIARDIKAENAIIAKAILGQGKAKFKLGNIKKAQVLIQASIQLHASTDAQNVIKEVEKMAYFESLLDFSLSNPLYSVNDDSSSSKLFIENQTTFSNSISSNANGSSLLPINIATNIYCSTIRSPISVSRIMTYQKYQPIQEDSWQHKFLKHTKKNSLVLYTSNSAALNVRTTV